MRLRRRWWGGGALVEKLQVVEPGELEPSPEYDYLKRLRQLQVRRAFVGWEVAPLAGEGNSLEGLVLTFASGRVLVMEATLREMAEAVRGGAEVACAKPLAEAQGLEPVLTLGGFARREAQLLRQKPQEVEVHRAGVAPVALWRASAWQRWRRKEPLSGKVWEMGLAHEFIDYYGETRADVLPFVPPTAKEVLEIGCARGFTGALLQEKLGCRVTGIELNPAVAREAASRLAEVVVGDVEGLELDRRFDAVIALELFEHLRDPFGFSAKVQGWLRPGGVMILSTPNVGHWSVVEDLLRGRWDYLPIGLLCYTHLRFFTRESLEDLLLMSGWAEVSIFPQINAAPKSVREWLQVPGAAWESLNTQGFWVVAKKGETLP